MSTRIIVILVVGLLCLGAGIAIGNSMAKKRAAKALAAGTTTPAIEEKPTV